MSPHHDDLPTIEDILPPAPPRRALDRRALAFGIPGLVAAFLVGSLVGVTAGAAALSSAAASPSASAVASAGAASGGPSTSPARTPSPAPPTLDPSLPRTFPVQEGSPTLVDWAPALRGLMLTTPLSIANLSSGEDWSAPHDVIGWFVNFEGPDDVWAWFGGLDVALVTMGFSHVDREAGPDGSTAAVFAPGFRGDAVRRTRDGRRSTSVSLWVSAASALPTGSFTDDPRGDLARRGCATAVRVPTAMAHLAAILRVPGASVEIARCQEDESSATWTSWDVQALLPGATDPAPIVDALATALDSAGVATRIGSWTYADTSGWSARTLWVSYSIDATALHAHDGRALSIGIGLDQYHLDAWSVSIRVDAADLTSAGAFIRDAAR